MFNVDFHGFSFSKRTPKSRENFLTRMCVGQSTGAICKNLHFTVHLYLVYCAKYPYFTLLIHIICFLLRPCLFNLLDYGIAALQKPKSEKKKKVLHYHFSPAFFFPPLIWPCMLTSLQFHVVD
jgi:hypothetical protein